MWYKSLQVKKLSSTVFNHIIIQIILLLIKFERRAEKQHKPGTKLKKKNVQMNLFVILLSYVQLGQMSPHV